MTAYKWKWTATINRETLTQLQELAEGLGYVVTSPGGLTGRPSPADMLDALAAAYAADPGGVHLALKVIGVYNAPAAQPAATNDDEPGDEGAAG